jgi:hypothetical protein
VLRRHQPGARPPDHGPSTIGTFLRAFAFGHTRQFDRLTQTALSREWAAGAGPVTDPLGWQPSRFLTTRAEAKRALQLAEQLGSVSAFCRWRTSVDHLE